MAAFSAASGTGTGASVGAGASSRNISSNGTYDVNGGGGDGTTCTSTEKTLTDKARVGGADDNGGSGDIGRLVSYVSEHPDPVSPDASGEIAMEIPEGEHDHEAVNGVEDDYSANGSGSGFDGNEVPKGADAPVNTDSPMHLQKLILEHEQMRRSTSNGNLGGLMRYVMHSTVLSLALALAHSPALLLALLKLSHPPRPHTAPRWILA